ncbi:hypothetical protein NMYAN_10295 [Nitrosomonas nitrosa]|uniref:Uncharacterized protein n=1 Tax=Nitrosomonas nitrosa TaxID=52442 RepID=A0A8H8YXP9_9PROT|nr:hypothetical protein NMYAN_10295 [Nitrosomonas nitrosa]
MQEQEPTQQNAASAKERVLSPSNVKNVTDQVGTDINPIFCAPWYSTQKFRLNS